MLVVILVYIAITLVELAVTSTNKYHESFIERLEGNTDLASYCDPDYYMLNITSLNADFDCKKRCKSLHGYITSRNELVCFVRKSQAKRISFSDDVEKCVCGHKSTHDDRRHCFPRLNLTPRNFKECDLECLNHTLLRSKKLNDNRNYNIMWCGKEWFKDNVILEMDSMVKVVGEVETQRKIIPTASCYCGSKTRKAKTFLSQETVLENEKRVILQTTEDPISNELAVACSYGKFRVKEKYKCESICTKTKGFILPDHGKLVCYSIVKASSRIKILQNAGDEIIENKNICECGATFGRTIRKIQPCIPAIREENKMDNGTNAFKNYCEKKCPEYDAYIASNSGMCGVRFCESRNAPSPKIFVNLDYKLGKEISSEDDTPLIECQCGLTELSFVRYRNENVNVGISISHIANSSIPVYSNDLDVFENTMENILTENPSSSYSGNNLLANLASDESFALFSPINDLPAGEFNRPLSTNEREISFQEFPENIFNEIRTSSSPSLNRGIRLDDYSIEDVFNGLSSIPSPTITSSASQNKRPNELPPIISSPQIFNSSNQKKRGFDEIMPGDYYPPLPTYHFGTGFDEFSLQELFPGLEDYYSVSDSSLHIYNNSSNKLMQNASTSQSQSHASQSS